MSNQLGIGLQRVNLQPSPNKSHETIQPGTITDLVLVIGVLEECLELFQLLLKSHTSRAIPVSGVRVMAGGGVGARVHRWHSCDCQPIKPVVFMVIKLIASLVCYHNLIEHDMIWFRSRSTGHVITYSALSPSTKL